MPFPWEDFVKHPSSAPPGNVPLWQERVIQATRDATRWAEEHTLATTYARDSAFASAVALPEEVPYPLVRVTTNLILWIYALDRVLDQPELRLVSSTVIDDALSLIRAGLAGDFSQTARPSHVSQHCQVLSHAISDLAADLALLWTEYPLPDLRPDRAAGFVAELTHLLDAMRTEVTLRASTAPLPTLDAYLEWARYSIGVPLISYVVASFSASGLAGWAAGEPALRHAACCVRLCNDISGHVLDAAASNVTSVLITQHASALAPLPLTAVLAQLRQRASIEADRFVAVAPSLPTAWLYAFLFTTVAYAMTRYESGGYVRVD